MKKLILSIIFLFPGIISFSQNYNPILQNIGWCVEEYIGLGSIMTAYTNNDDTIIGGYIYAKILKGNTLLLIREDAGLQKAWVIFPNSTEERLLYDFNISLGSQITLNYIGDIPVAYTVDSFDSVNTPLGLKKRIKLSTTDTVFDPVLYWIEGIGSSYGPVYLFDPTYAQGTMSLGHCLICAYVGVGIQSYSGSCGIPCIGYQTPCSSFITGINDLQKDYSEISIEKVTTDVVCIRLQNDKINKLKLFSLEGRLLKCVQNINNHEFLISTNEWTTGIYIIELTSENNTIIKRKFCK